MSGVEAFELAGYAGEINERYLPADLQAQIARLVDPACSSETLHWGRNYLYSSRLETLDGAVSVVVKQFRIQGPRQRLKRWLSGDRAIKSWRAGLRLMAAGVATPEPVMLILSSDPRGPSFYVTRLVESFVEMRYLFRALKQDCLEAEFPGVDRRGLFEPLGRYLRRLHDARFRHRDLSIGNLLVTDPGSPEQAFQLIDLNRARLGARLGVHGRTRDLCRLPIVDRAARQAFLDGYWSLEGGGTPGKTFLFTAYVRLFLLRTMLKDGSRKPLRFVGDLLTRSTHAHIPPPPAGAASRDKAVWDHLSDQPHQHAGRLERSRVRFQDARIHGRAFLAASRHAVGVWRRYRRLQANLYSQPVPWRGVGVAVQPSPATPDQLLAALEDLGVRDVLIRLQPWRQDLADEEYLARELHSRGYDLTFALPQNRQLVAEPERWREAIERIADSFSAYGHRFQVGQAINRSKWGIWNYEEYLRLAAQASGILRARGGVTILGPAVIDFEFHATLAVLNMRHPGFFVDVVSSLLYVDRRGAPENRQLGFDTVDKVVLLRAIAEASRYCGDECWITEFNWPLWEGPHSPAGKNVSVDEETQADYLVRFCVLALTTGLVERVYWWRLAARGYGLLDPADSRALRRRPAFHALRNLQRQLEGATFERPLSAPAGARLFQFRTGAGEQVVVGWSTSGESEVDLPAAASERVGRDGASEEGAGATRAVLRSSPCYLRLS